MIGPGKYDDLATYVRETAKAEGVVVLVLGVEKGNGMSAQLPLSLTLYVVAMLRHVADEIEQSGMKNPLAGYVPAWYAWFIAVCAFVVGYMVGGK